MCCFHLCIILFLWQWVKQSAGQTKQNTHQLNSVLVHVLQYRTTQNPGKPLWAQCAQLALGDNQWCQNPIQTVCAAGRWAEVSFVASRSGLNSAVKNFDDIKQITTSLHLWVLSVKIPVSDFGEVESAYHRLTSMVFFPESPHWLEFEIPLRAFLTIRRDKA